MNHIYILRLTELELNQPNLIYLFEECLIIV